MKSGELLNLHLMRWAFVSVSRMVSKYRNQSIFEHPFRKQSSQRLDVGLGARIAVVADSHSHLHPNTISILSNAQPSYILHAGDIGDSKVLKSLERVAPTIAVRGNIDARGPALVDDVLLTLHSENKVLSRWLLTHIAVARRKIRSDALSLAHQKDAQLIICGHSHVPLLLSEKGVALFNPGSCGPRRFRLPILVGFIELLSTGINCYHWCCETNQRWIPPTHVA